MNEPGSFDPFEGLRGLRVLLVEDEFLILLDLQMVLEDCGAEVLTASSLAEALDMAECACDVAVLDVRLPDGEVYPAARKLVRRHVPIVFHSGHAHNDNIEEAFPDAVALAKPAHEDVLLAAVERQARGGAAAS